MRKARYSARMRTKVVDAAAILRVPHAQRRVRGGRDEAVVFEVEQADEGGVAFEVEEAVPSFERPDFDEVVHGAAHAAVAVVVEDDAVDFLAVAGEPVDQLAGGDFPDAHGRVVAAADESVAVGGYGADGVEMADETADEVGVFGFVLGRGGLLDFCVGQAGQSPDSARRVA